MAKVPRLSNKVSATEPHRNLAARTECCCDTGKVVNRQVLDLAKTGLTGSRSAAQIMAVASIRITVSGSFVRLPCEHVTDWLN